MSYIKSPTLQQKRFVKEYLRTGSRIKAAELAYPNQNKDTRNVSANNNLNHSLAVKKYLNELLDAYGLSDEKIAKGLNKIVDAGTTESALKTATPKDAMSAIKFASELKDLLPAKKIEQKSASVNLKLEGKSDVEMNELLANLSKEIKDFQNMVEDTKKNVL